MPSLFACYVSSVPMPRHYRDHLEEDIVSEILYYNPCVGREGILFEVTFIADLSRLHVSRPVFGIWQKCKGFCQIAERKPRPLRYRLDFLINLCGLSLLIIRPEHRAIRI